jgi:hypothetical protein
VIAFQSLLANIETAKTVSIHMRPTPSSPPTAQVYLHASGGSQTAEVSRAEFLRAGQALSGLTPLEADILFSLSEWLHGSPSLVYSDLQRLAPEQYMQQVTRRLVDWRLVERPEDRNGVIRLLEFLYRLSIGSVGPARSDGKHFMLDNQVSGIMGAATMYPSDLVKTRLMNQRNARTYSDGLDCVSKVGST